MGVTLQFRPLLQESIDPINVFRPFQPLRRLILGNQFIEGVWFDMISQNNIPCR